jgi:hypothetical protein
MENLGGYTDTELREELARRGYYTENLWTINDVNYHCSKEEALKVIDTVMQSEWLVSNIFEMIEEEASDLYEPVEEELPE